MKFLLITLVLCLAAGTQADVKAGAAVAGGGGEKGGEDGGGFFDFEPDFSEQVEEETVTKRYKLTWLEKLMQGYEEGKKQGVFPPIEGSLNAIVTGVLETSRGSLKGLEPSVQAVYVTPIPTLRIILAGAKMKVCRPETHLEFLLNHVICFVNGPLYLALAVSPLPICIKGKEVQCWGPFMRLPDTLTPGMIESGTMGLGEGDWLQDLKLEEVDATGDTINEQPIETKTTEETTTTDGTPDSGGVTVEGASEAA